MIGIRARMPDFPKQQIWLTLHVNPPGGDELLISGTIEVMCSVSSFRHFAADPQKVDALLQFGNRAWNGVDGGPAYGYGNLAISPHYLSAVHVGMAGGEPQIMARLPGLRIEGLNHGGLVVVATDSPLPDDTEDNRRRFLRVHAALQPAFLSREETSENWRRMLGCFYRERVSVIP